MGIKKGDKYLHFSGGDPIVIKRVTDSRVYYDFKDLRGDVKEGSCLIKEFTGEAINIKGDVVQRWKRIGKARY